MANKPKETTRTRSMARGGTKTVTKSKGVDAQGTTYKRRTVVKEKDSYNPFGNPTGGKNVVTKDVVKQKFASGVTRKVKSLSSSASRKVGEETWNKQTTAQKTRIAGKGLLNKVKALAKPAQKTGHASSSFDGIIGREGKANYDRAKSIVKKVSKKIGER